jgi:hypothetical protein
MPNKAKNPHAVALGKLGGRKGGLATHRKLPPEQRRENAKKAGDARGAARMMPLTPTKRKEIAQKAARSQWSKEG